MTLTKFCVALRGMVRAMVAGELGLVVVGQSCWATDITIVQVAPLTGVLASTGE
ncbi:MAG: hypothetical protein H7293_04240 [Candidatus Saccharibacteria bacterium]|nr:hypothetical protein [Rhodoferax sp.]